MIIVTTNNIPEKNIKKTIGLVKGSTVRTKNFVNDISAAFKNLAGGELIEYNEMLTEARKIAIGRMVEEAESLGANAIVGFRLSSSSIMSSAAEIIAYGTAVFVE